MSLLFIGEASLTKDQQSEDELKKIVEEQPMSATPTSSDGDMVKHTPDICSKCKHSMDSHGEEVTGNSKTCEWWCTECYEKSCK